MGIRRQTDSRRINFLCILMYGFVSMEHLPLFVICIIINIIINQLYSRNQQVNLQMEEKKVKIVHHKSKTVGVKKCSEKLKS